MALFSLLKEKILSDKLLLYHVGTSTYVNEPLTLELR